jgi:hypothetical protein
MSHKIMYIKWVDSTSWNTWKELPIDDTELVTIETIGFVIEKHKNRIVLAHSVSDAEHCTGIIAIPMACIIEKRMIKDE